MRELTLNEINVVSGAECAAGNNYGGMTDTSSFGNDLIQIYEGVVAETSYMMERFANAL